jgi:two-component system sensor histidine kinase KdpD
MAEQRPDPDRLLAQVQRDAGERARGQLKVFFGMAAGVGKTYAMLEAAHEQRRAGVDVVAGYVETHGRAETEALLRDLEVLPRRQVAYRGATLEEFDLDAALARRPQLILVDELAHTNAEGSRHPKRWQDVLELLDAGIDVYTTVNVQHLESLNDVVAQITGVQVRETVPDRVLERADELELIDLPPDDLLQRLREGKVYRPQQAERAAQSFFRKGNLLALRELALRRTADRVNAQVGRYRGEHAIGKPWPTRERILVGVSANALAPQLVRAASRMAEALRAEWIVAYVETPEHLRLEEHEREGVVQTLRLAEQLGAETVTLAGARVSDELLAYAHARNASKIVVGKPVKPRWRELAFGSVVDSVVRGSGAIDVYVITGEHDDTAQANRPGFQRTSDSGAYGWALAIVVACTTLGWAGRQLYPDFAEANVIMAYLLGVLIAATRFGRGPSVVVSVLGVAAFDFFFVPPFLTFAVSDTQYLLTFGVMLAVALVISALTGRSRQQALLARQRERRTAALYALSRELAGTSSLDALLHSIIARVSETFDARVVVLLPVNKTVQPWGGVAGWWGKRLEEQAIYAPDTQEQGVAQWVFEHRQAAGLGTTTLAGAKAIYLPLLAARGAVGVLGVLPARLAQLREPEQLHLLETCAQQAAQAIERANLAEEAQRMQVRAETEQLRNSLLSAVSHDLRTPLATITGVTSTLASDDALDAATRRELAQSAYDEADRLNRLVSNLLDMTKIESGAIRVQKEWQPLEEVVGAALTRLEGRLASRSVQVVVPTGLPLVPLDGVLIEQVVINLLDNALKYTPPGSPIAIEAQRGAEGVTIGVADQGPGIPPGDEARIFEKFYRASSVAGRGSGLGLAICKGIVEAHGGRIWAEHRTGGGAAVRFTLPLDGPPPPEPIAPPAAHATNRTETS